LAAGAVMVEAADCGAPAEAHKLPEPANRSTTLYRDAAFSLTSLAATAVVVDFEEAVRAHSPA